MSLDETDAKVRRDTLTQMARLLDERESVVRQINTYLANVDVLRFDRERIDELLDQLENHDRRLMQSRFAIALSNATLIDKLLVGVVSFFKARLQWSTAHFWLQLFAMVMVTLAGFATFQYAETIIGWFLKALGRASFLTPAYAATEIPSTEGVKVILLLLFGVVIALLFVWFAAVSTLSKNSQTRKSAMEFLKTAFAFATGLVTGYFAKPFRRSSISVGAIDITWYF